MDEEAHSTARTERIRIEVDSREIATRAGNYHNFDWRDYNGNFVVPDTGGAQDVLRFLK